MKYQLHFIQGPLSGQTFDLGYRALSIGRNKNSGDIKIDSPTVSSRHATIQVVGDKIMLTVISQHTTLIDGKRVQPQMEPYPIAIGSNITLGADTKFAVESLDDAMDAGKTGGNEAVDTDNPENSSQTGGRTATVSASSLPSNAPQTDPNATSFDAPMTATVSASKLPSNTPQAYPPNATGFDVPMTATVSASNLPPNARQADPNATSFDISQTETVGAKQIPRMPSAGGATAVSANPNVPADQTDGGTVAMGTNRLTPEKIKKIIEEQKRKERVKVAIWTGGLAFALLLLIIIHNLIANKPPKGQLEWPRSGNSLLRAELPLEIPGYENQLKLIFPKCTGNSISREKETGKILINTFAGQEKDVAIRILVEYSKDPQLLYLDRGSAFKAWQKTKVEKLENAWNFEPTLPLSFIHLDNGFPYLPAFYTRKRGKQKVFGVACYFRQADIQLTILVDMDTPCFPERNLDTFFREKRVPAIPETLTKNKPTFLPSTRADS